MYQHMLIACAWFAIVPGQAASAAAQTIKIGIPEQCYSYPELCGITTVCPQGPYRSQGKGLCIDAAVITLRNNGIMTFLVSGWQGMDRYDSKDLLKPFSQPERPQAWQKQLFQLWNNKQPVLKKEKYPCFDLRDSTTTLRYYGDASSPHWVDIAWIPNAYIINSHELLGFVHVESTRSDYVSNSNPYEFYKNAVATENHGNYAVGIAYSDDFGDSWWYCGDIIRTYCLDGNLMRNNISGVPFLVVPVKGRDYFYVYFNEYIKSTNNEDDTRYPQRRLCVARAKVNDVVSDARNIKVNSGIVGAGGFATGKRTVSTWTKFTGDITASPAVISWADVPATRTRSDGGSVGGNCIPLYRTSQYYDSAGYPKKFIDCCDFHSDAVYCAALKKYLITVNTAGFGKLLLYSSSDGVRWGNPMLVDDQFRGDWNVHLEHSFFVSLDKDASDDCRIVGRHFYIVYPVTEGTYNSSDFKQTLFRRKVDIIAGADTIR